MKLNYQKPEAIRICCYGDIVVMQSSIQEPPESDRSIGGGVTEGGDGLPNTVGETGDNTDPYAGHGQGSGGSGSRAKSGMIWDEW